MMFRSVRLYRVTSAWPESALELSDLLGANRFKPCGTYSERSSGWEAPGNREDELLSRRVNGADLLRLRCQSKVLPMAAVREALEERIDDFRSRMGEDPSRSGVRRLKEETRDELLPKALLKSDRIQGFFILSERVLGIDTTSESKAELFIDQLRASLDDFEFTPLNYNQHPGELLTGMFLGDVPPSFSLGRECRMQDMSEKKSTGTWRDVELSDSAIRQHVIDGMQLTHLAVEYDQVMSCVISADGTLSKLKFVGVEAADNGAQEEALAQQDAEFVLLTGTLRRLIVELKQLLGGYLSHESERAAA